MVFKDVRQVLKEEHDTIVRCHLEVTATPIVQDGGYIVNVTRHGKVIGYSNRVETKEDMRELIHSSIKEFETIISDKEWRCFHCDEVFVTQEEAKEHFGNNSNATPQCVLFKCLCNACPNNPLECKGKHGFERPNGPKEEE